MAGTGNGNGEVGWLRWAIRLISGAWVAWATATLITIKIDVAIVKENQGAIKETIQDVRRLDSDLNRHYAQGEERDLKIKEVRERVLALEQRVYRTGP